ncbi:polar amino acid ABC transporter permease [Robbsia andropogonis]|uniref:Polar amino acid ABC transporter permease n=1 Tax=Robbsia andropogonis TaxID=28092 RepID=A0A0F5JZX5_9BURK|nr:ABC transporter permease subunit [Robbsia andropogonis]KKB63436.1 polar amino acid ABC transporter permease [Robbsia andropogonis]
MRFDLDVLSGHWSDLAQGFGGTLWLCAAGAVMSSLLGGLLTMGQRCGAPWLVTLIRGYTALTLGLPLLVLLYVTFFVLPDFGVLLPAPLVGTATLAIYYGPYVAEVMHAAIDAVPAGSIEAGIAIGMSPAKITRRIIAPQALPLLLPTLTGLLIGLLKDSALLSVISVHEFMFAAKAVVSDTYAPLEVYFVVALVYWAATSVIHLLTRHWERRLDSTQRVALSR